MLMESWPTGPDRDCASLPDAKRSPRRWFSTAAPCSPRRNRVAGPGYYGAKRRKGSKVHAAVDTLGHLLALHVTPADEQDRAQVGELARQVQQLTGDHVKVAFVDQGYTGEAAAEAAEQRGPQLEVVKHTQAKPRFVLLPRRWVVERSFAWAARLRRLARDYERLAATLDAFHFLACACLMLAHHVQDARCNLITGSRSIVFIS